jgi:type II secretion system protein G
MRRVFAFWPLGFVPFVVALVLVARFGSIVDLKITKAQADLGSIDTALDIYKSKHGDFPNEADGLAELTRDNWPLYRVSQDPWGNSYLYRHTAGTDSYLLYSPGVDHRDGGGSGDDVILGSKTYRCSDYGVNCPPTASQVGAWIALALAVFSLVVGITRLFRPLKLPDSHGSGS